MPMTKQEQAVVRALGDAWGEFLKLPTEHPDEKLEFRLAVHAAQSLILARPAARELNDRDKIYEREWD